MKNILSALVISVACFSASTIAETLVVYTPQGDAVRGSFIAQAAKKATGIDVKFLTGNGGDIHDRLIAERNNRQADVVFGLTQIGMYSLKQKDLFHNYEPAWTQGLPAAYQDTDHAFHMFWQTPIVLAYNADFVSEAEAPKSWLDLTKPEFKRKFIITGLSSQTTRTYLSAILYQFREGDEISDAGWSYLRDMYDNSASAAEGTEYWRKVASGEAPIVMNWFGGVMNNSEANGINIKFVTPESGTPIISEGIGIIKGTDKLETAQKFVDWFGSPEFMAAYANEFGQTPSHPKAIELSNDTIKKFATMFDAQDLDWQYIAEHQNEWIENIQLDVM